MTEGDPTGSEDFLKYYNIIIFMLESKGIITQSLWSISGAFSYLTFAACLQMMTFLFNNNIVIYPVGIWKPHVCLPSATDLLILSLHASNTISWQILQESAEHGGAGMETFWRPMRLCREVNFSEHVTHSPSPQWKKTQFSHNWPTDTW